jgi:hypothetical protein
MSDQMFIIIDGQITVPWELRNLHIPLDAITVDANGKFSITLPPFKAWED